MQRHARNIDEAGDPSSKERHARACQTTVITGATSIVRHHGAILDSIARNGEPPECDVLTVLDPMAVHGRSSRALLRQVVDDAILTLSRHGVERIVVATEGEPDELVTAIRRQFQLSIMEHPDLVLELAAIVNTPIVGLALGEAPESDEADEAVIMCIDYRMWRRPAANNTDLITATLRKIFRLDERPAMLVTPGGARDIVCHESASRVRWHTVRGQLLARHDQKRWRRITALCHTGCAMFGGHEAFTGPEHQQAHLRDWLDKARHELGQLFPGTRVETGIVNVNTDNTVGEIVPLTL